MKHILTLWQHKYKKLLWALGCFSQQGIDITKSVEIMLAPFLSLHSTRVKASCQQYNKYTYMLNMSLKTWKIYSVLLPISCEAIVVSKSPYTLLPNGLEVNDSCTIWFSMASQPSCWQAALWILFFFFGGEFQQWEGWQSTSSPFKSIPKFT